MSPQLNFFLFNFYIKIANGSQHLMNQVPIFHYKDHKKKRGGKNIRWTGWKKLYHSSLLCLMQLPLCASYKRRPDQKCCGATLCFQICASQNYGQLYHQLDGREFEWTLGVGDGQGALACCDSWGHKESDTTERLNWNELTSDIFISPHYLWSINCVPCILGHADKVINKTKINHNFMEVAS